MWRMWLCVGGVWPATVWAIGGSMASLKSTNFDTMLRLGGGWALGRRREGDRSWTALHLHGCNNYGWCMLYKAACSMCDEAFPDKVIGMLNMMKALD